MTPQCLIPEDPDGDDKQAGLVVSSAARALTRVARKLNLPRADVGQRNQLN